MKVPIIKDTKRMNAPVIQEYVAQSRFCGSAAKRQASTKHAAGSVTLKSSKPLIPWTQPCQVYGMALMGVPGGYPPPGSVTNTPAITRPSPNKPTSLGPQTEALPVGQIRRSPTAKAMIREPQ